MTALSLETYARLLAQLACRRGVRLEKILADLGVTDDDLRGSEPALRQELADALERRKGIGAMKFAAALGAELARLGPLDGAGAEQPNMPLPDELATRPRDGEKATPSYLQAPQQPVTWHQASSGSPPIAPPLVAQVSLAADPSRAPLPSSPTETVAAEDGGGPPAASSIMAENVRADAPSQAKPWPKALGGTMDADLSAIVAAVKSGALPFADRGPSPAAPREVRGEPRSSGESRPGSHGGTMDADLSAIVAAIKSGAIPFADQSLSLSSVESIDLGLLPLETYASVSGALARGESRQSVLAEHHLSPEVFERLARAWATRFQREPHLLERFKDLARNNASLVRRGE